MEEIKVIKINTDEELKEAYLIRNIVFVEEQAVDPELEYDEFEDSSIHFLAYLEGIPVGTARYRFTEKGIKMERFAVLKFARGKNVGKALVNACLKSIKSNPEGAGKMIYLHAQVAAIGFYKAFGFQTVGEIFSEAEILHSKMVMK